MSPKKFVMVALLSSLMGVSASAQSVWPKIQSDMYPYVGGLMLVRHDQSVLLGESTQQTGVFFATIKNTYSEKVQNQLLADASTKGWRLHSFYRYGTSYAMTMTQGSRILDIRLTNHDEGVDVVYSVVLRQVNPATTVSVNRPGSTGQPDAIPKDISDGQKVTTPVEYLVINSKGVEVTPFESTYLKESANSGFSAKFGQ